MIEGDNIPGNINTPKVDLNNGGWILIAILIALLIITFFIAVYINYKNQKKINKLKEYIRKDISEKEYDLILKYRILNNNDKTVIDDTLKSLNKNHNDNYNPTE